MKSQHNKTEIIIVSIVLFSLFIYAFYGLIMIQVKKDFNGEVVKLLEWHIDNYFDYDEQD